MTTSPRRRRHTIKALTKKGREKGRLVACAQRRKLHSEWWTVQGEINGRYGRSSEGKSQFRPKQIVDALIGFWKNRVVLLLLDCSVHGTCVVQSSDRYPRFGRAAEGEACGRGGRRLDRSRERHVRARCGFARECEIYDYPQLLKTWWMNSR